MFLCSLSLMTIDGIAPVAEILKSYFFGSIIFKFIWSIFAALIKKTASSIILITTKSVDQL